MSNTYQKPKVRMMYHDYRLMRDILEDLDDRTDRETGLLEKIRYIIRAIERHDKRAAPPEPSAPQYVESA